MFARFIGFGVGHDAQYHLPIHESEDTEAVGQESFDGLTDGEECDDSDTGYGGGDTEDGVDTGEGSQSEKGESEDESTFDELEDSDGDISIEGSETDGDLDDEDGPQFKF